MSLNCEKNRGQDLYGNFFGYSKSFTPYGVIDTRESGSALSVNFFEMSYYTGREKKRQDEDWSRHGGKNSRDPVN